MANIKEAFEYAAQNPNSDFANNLKQLVISGSLDQEAKKYGIDLTPLKPKEETFLDRLKTSVQKRGEQIKEGAGLLKEQFTSEMQKPLSEQDPFKGAKGVSKIVSGTFGTVSDIGTNLGQTVDKTQAQLTGTEILPKIGEGIQSVLSQPSEGGLLKDLVGGETVGETVGNLIQTVAPEGSLRSEIAKGTGNILGAAGTVSSVKGLAKAGAKNFKTGYTTAEDVFNSAKNIKSNLRSYVGSKTVEPQFTSSAKRLIKSTIRKETPLETYNKYYPQATKSLTDIKVDDPISSVGSKIGDNFKQVVNLRKKVGEKMGQEIKTVGKLKTNIEPIFENFEKDLFENGLTYNGLTKKIVANNLSKVAPDDILIIEDFIKDLNSIGTNPSVAQIDSLISRAADKITYTKSAKGMISTTNGERMVKGVLNSLRNKFDEIPELANYANARKNYAELSNFIDEGAGFLGKVTQSGDFAKDASIAKSSVQSILNNGKKDWLLKLEALTDYPALDESVLALQAMKDAGSYKGLSLLETLTEGGLPTSKSGFTQQIFDYVAEKGKRVLAGTPAERTKSYLKSLENSGTNIAPSNIIKKTATPKKGLTNIPNNKGIKKSNVDISDNIPQTTSKVNKNVDKSLWNKFKDEMKKPKKAFIKIGSETENIPFKIKLEGKGNSFKSISNKMDKKDTELLLKFADSYSNKTVDDELNGEIIKRLSVMGIKNAEDLTYPQTKKVVDKILDVRVGKIRQK